MSARGETWCAHGQHWHESQDADDLLIDPAAREYVCRACRMGWTGQHPESVDSRDT